MAVIKDLEQRITEAEIAVLNAEIRKGAEIIGAALGKYLPVPGGDKEISEVAKGVSKSINEMSWAYSAYYGGYSLAKTAPDFRPDGLFLEAVRSFATQQFLERIAEIESIAHEAHGMAENTSRN